MSALRVAARVVAVTVAVGVLAGIGYTTYRFRLIAVGTGSMQPVIAPGDRFVVDTARSGTAAVGDVVVVDAPDWTPDGGTTLVVKRVVATAGQRVVCCDPRGNLSVDGRVLAGTGLGPPVRGPDGARNAAGVPFDLTVPAGRVFLLGDNYGVSLDSRAHTADAGGGTLPVSAVLGPATFRLWPADAFGPINPGPGPG